MLWSESTLDSRIFLAVEIESVIIIMSWISLISMVEMRPMQIAMSSALIDMTLID